jgi:hypothetical protein
VSADALRAVRARIASGWSREVGARDSAGNEVPLTSTDAAAWSLCSAFALAGKDGIPMNHLPRALRALAEVTGMQSMEAWNDDAARTQQQVLDALDDAIERVEGVDGRA